MIIARIDGCFYEANHVDFNDFEFLICAANVAGYLEAEDKIAVGSDMNLTEFIISKYEYWFNEGWKEFSFEEFIEKELIKEFGFEED